MIILSVHMYSSIPVYKLARRQLATMLYHAPIHMTTRIPLVMRPSPWMVVELDHIVQIGEH